MIIIDKKNLYLEQLRPFRMAYVRQTGPYGPSNMQTMERLKQWANQKELLKEDAILYGIPQDDPRITMPEHCRYDACIVISDDFNLEQEPGLDISLGKSPSGNYLTITIPHTVEGIQKAWNEMIPQLHLNGYRMDNTKPVIERYCLPLLDQHLCELCIPVTTD
ncbi:DNA gyrase inhibitor [Paenibacillus amylolyticus]|uniref:DNA gyrase inhibitor n=1 Tax=Paenibacillus amylolyticus TaxID=1451 RepID=A0A5M9WQM5_PAEAM|nr:GyrI-like domain-containing protein [Paenibacillus amylolyticus]KAA8783833.1 DNA gyrase inhibitor [Paenibacillus amylolyticus]